MSTGRGNGNRYMPGIKPIEAAETDQSDQTEIDLEELVSGKITCDILSCSTIEVDDSIICNGVVAAALSEINELALGAIIVEENIIMVDPEKKK